MTNLEMLDPFRTVSQDRILYDIDWLCWFVMRQQRGFSDILDGGSWWITGYPPTDSRGVEPRTVGRMHCAEFHRDDKEYLNECMSWSPLFPAVGPTINRHVMCMRMGPSRTIAPKKQYGHVLWWLDDGYCRTCSLKACFQKWCGSLYKLLIKGFKDDAVL